MKALLKQVRISPKKANLVAGMVRGKSVEEALLLLKYLPKKPADILKKIIQSAIANAENNFGQDKTKLIIKKILVTKGATYKRWMPNSRGRSSPLLKRTSHISVEVGI
ncbi:50S ribosomal protein L22 [Candidatus Peregrinibacteria bacterium]|nr:50S ribosomal protein L22 [Candidatus Peregrinibacteria bacterium]